MTPRRERLAASEQLRPAEPLLDVQRQPGYVELIYRHWHDEIGHQIMRSFPEASLQVKALDLESIFIHLQAQKEEAIDAIF